MYNYDHHSGTGWSYAQDWTTTEARGAKLFRFFVCRGVVPLVIHTLLSECRVDDNKFNFLCFFMASAGNASGAQVTVRLVDARVPMLPRGYRAGLLFCKDHGDWRRAMILMEDMRVAGKRPSGGHTSYEQDTRSMMCADVLILSRPLPIFQDIWCKLCRFSWSKAPHLVCPAKVC